MALELHITKKGETTCVALLGGLELAGVELAPQADDGLRALNP